MTFEDFEEKHTLVRLALHNKIDRQVKYETVHWTYKQVRNQAWDQLQNRIYGDIYERLANIYDLGTEV